MTKFDSCKAFHFSHSFSVLFKKETSAAASSSSSVRRVSEPELATNAVVIVKEEIMEQDSDYEEFPAYSLEISPEAAADVKVKLEEIFDWSGQEDADEDGTSY